MQEAIEKIEEVGLKYTTKLEESEIVEEGFVIRTEPKSGSTKTDNWMAGYNKDICCVVWTGFDDNKEITKAADLKSAKLIWADTVEASYYNNKEGIWYDTPSDVIGVDLNPTSGFYPSFTEYYKTVYLKVDNLPWFVRLLLKEENSFLN